MILLGMGDKMKVKHEYPPNIDNIRAVLLPPATAIFTYGDTCYIPNGAFLDSNIEAHESIHVLQQGDNPEAWWDRYLDDSVFRYEEELEAYRAQYAHAKATMNRNRRRMLLHSISRHFSSAMYGNIVTRDEAEKAIKQ